MHEHPDNSHGSSSDSDLAPLYIVEPSSAHTHSIIFLHGLGSNGQKFGSELLQTGICSSGQSLQDLLPGARFIFPTAKKRRSSAFGRRAKPTQWFDVASLDDPSYRRHTQIQGLEESTRQILGLVRVEVAKVSAQNVILGGLSQGMAIGSICLLAMESPIGGFVGMSGWMPYRDDIQDASEGTRAMDGSDDEVVFGRDEEETLDDASQDKHQTLQEPVLKVVEFVQDLVSLSSSTSLNSIAQTAIATPVFLGHGGADEKIVPSLGEEARDTLQAIGFQTKWNRYEGQGHWYKVPDEIDDLVEFARKNIGWTLTGDS